MQQGLLFHASLDDQGPDVYVGQHILRIEGQLDPDTLRASWAALLRRHDNLRACFRQPDSVAHPVQIVLDHVELPWRFVDLSGSPANEALAEAERLAEQERGRRFDLAVP